MFPDYTVDQDYNNLHYSVDTADSVDSAADIPNYAELHHNLHNNCLARQEL